MRSARWALKLVPLGLAASFVLLAGSLGACRRSNRTPQPPPSVEPAPDPWKEAARKVEEDRGEPTGRKASLAIPAELRQYADRRRFLAMQVAEARASHLSLVKDYSDLAAQVRNGEMVEMPQVGDDYVLYGVGGLATDQPFMHYDIASGDSVPIFATDEEFAREDARLRESLIDPQARLAEFQSELKRTPRRDAARRRALVQQVEESRHAVEEIVRHQQLLESFYLEPARRREISSDYQNIAAVASDFGGRAYDLQSPTERRELKVRLLSLIRPAARDLLLALARSYRSQFGRPLPVTSLVRPEEYQKRLSETNPNATRIATPPHATGLAFDLYYFYMTGAEQEYLMLRISALKRHGLVEALRENRDNIHVFAFARGVPPDERLVIDAIKHSEPNMAGARLAKTRPRPANSAHTGRGRGSVRRGSAFRNHHQS